MHSGPIVSFVPFVPFVPFVVRVSLVVRAAPSRWEAHLVVHG